MKSLDVLKQEFQKPGDIGKPCIFAKFIVAAEPIIVCEQNCREKLMDGKTCRHSDLTRPTERPPAQHDTDRNIRVNL